MKPSHRLPVDSRPPWMTVLYHSNRLSPNKARCTILLAPGIVKDGDFGRDETLLRKAVFCNDSLCGSGLQEEGSSGFLGNASVHLDAGEYWSNQAAQFKGKPHRAVFEESRDKIYRNMYRKASSTS